MWGEREELDLGCVLVAADGRVGAVGQQCEGQACGAHSLPHYEVVDCEFVVAARKTQVTQRQVLERVGGERGCCGSRGWCCSAGLVRQRCRVDVVVVAVVDVVAAVEGEESQLCEVGAGEHVVAGFERMVCRVKCAGPCMVC